MEKTKRGAGEGRGKLKVVEKSYRVKKAERGAGKSQWEGEAERSGEKL